jgi:hypothetical protein
MLAPSRRAFEKSMPRKIGGAKITVAEVDATGVEPAQVEMAEVAGCQLASLALGFAVIELFDFSVAQQLVERVFVGERFQPLLAIFR